jgi:hypothetical protein
MFFEEMKRYPTSAVSTYAPIKSNAPAPTQYGYYSIFEFFFFTVFHYVQYVQFWKRDKLYLNKASQNDQLIKKIKKSITQSISSIPRVHSFPILRVKGKM